MYKKRTIPAVLILLLLLLLMTTTVRIIITLTFIFGIIIIISTLISNRETAPKDYNSGEYGGGWRGSGGLGEFGGRGFRDR